MSAIWDIVVVGGGSNSLSAGAYMAKAGKSVLVLEKNDHVGGGAVSTEVAPGFIHDPHATGLMTCFSSPALRNDELGLFSRFGLEFVEWDAAFTTLFDDGSILVSSKSIDDTAASIAQFSAKDAEAYRELGRRCVTLAPLLSMGMANPPMPFSRFTAMLEGNELGDEVVRSFFVSAYDVICQYFESTEVRLHHLKWIGEAMENPEANGTGILVFNLFALVHANGAFAVKGGTQQLSNKLAEAITAFGGTVRCNAEVARVLVSDGKATGVVLSDGEEIRARDGVIASIHPWLLGDLVPETDPVVAAQARRVKLSNHGAVNQQISLAVEPEYIGGNDPILKKSMVVEYMPRGDFEAMRKIYDGYKYGEVPTGHFNPLTIINSYIDKTRVPKPENCALYLYHFAPMALKEGGLAAWEDMRDSYAEQVWTAFKAYTTNIRDEHILGRLVEAPLDHQRHSASMQMGDIFGIGTAGGQILGRRPTPALANYRVPGVERLYLTGPFMHPGGTVTLGGRPTAMVMCQDLGVGLGSVFHL